MVQQSKSIFAKYKWLIMGGSVLLAVAAIGYFSRAKPVEVVLLKVERGMVEASVSNNRAGTVKACRRAKMSPPAGGQISKMKVKRAS
ncbi:MAG: efflux RND transporter periplasmic adaptor subunit, partial [Gallionellaceae bacterium]